nr:sulfite exporter TauE/SafE family protein [Alteromonas sp. ASW11-36]
MYRNHYFTSSIYLYIVYYKYKIFKCEYNILLTVFISALIIGLSLGLLGAGGSILTVPVLAYGVGFSEKQAIVGALFIVAAISLSTVLINSRKGKINFRAAIWMSVTGMLGSALAAGGSNYLSGHTQFIILALIMLLASWRMLKSTKSTDPGDKAGKLRLVLTGIGLGVVTGLVGVGGGFLIVPALVTLIRIPMQQAVNTSLTIIFFNAFAGLANHWYTNQPLIHSIDWSVLVTFALIGIVGSMFGQAFAQKLPQSLLKKGFAWIILLVALGILAHSVSQIIMLR